MKIINNVSKRALISTLLMILSAAPCLANYKAKAEEVTDYIQTHFYDKPTQRYWRFYPSNNLYAWSWGNGVQLYVLAEAVKNDPKKYKEKLYDFTNGMQSYWEPTAIVPCYNAYYDGPDGYEQYYDDNEWIVMAYADAYESTGDIRFLQFAYLTQSFVLSGWDDKLGGGIYWRVDHKTKNTCSNAPAAVAALMIASITEDQNQVAWAKKIKQWVNQTLRDNDGLYFDNISLDGQISKSKWSYNTALMISADVMLYNRFHDASYLSDAMRTGDAALAYWTDPATGSLQNHDDEPIFTHLLCQSFIELYEATHDLKYLDAVRREASFAYRYARDRQGGYWDHWTTKAQQPNQEKSLIGNASAAYLFWILSPYPDVDNLSKSATNAAAAGNYATAAGYFRQAVDSDPYDADAKTKLYQTLVREHKLEAASGEVEQLVAASK